MPETLTASPTEPKPTAAPTPSPEPSPDIPPAPEPAPDQTQADLDAFSAMEARWDKRNAPKPEEKVPDKTEDKATEPPAKEPEEKVPEAPPDKTRPDKTISQPKALRQQIDSLTGELKAKSTAYAELEAKYRALEPKGKETTALAERLASTEKQLEETRASLRAAKQELSPEFKEKYDKPFDEAAATARTEIEALAIVDEEGQPVRQANWEKDFANLYNLEYIEAKKRSKQMFGDDSGLVMEHYLRLHRMANERNKALEAEKAQWSERTKADEARRVQQREAFEQASSKVEQALVAKHPDLYGEDPKDPEGNQLLKEGLALVDSTPKTLQDAAVLKANIRLRAAASFRLAAQNKRLAQEVADLKKTLEELKSSGPGPTKRPSGAEPKPEKDWRTALHEEMA